MKTIHQIILLALLAGSCFSAIAQQRPPPIATNDEQLAQAKFIHRLARRRDAGF
jgi:hypothetical protein